MNVRVTLGFVAAVVVLAAIVFGLDKFNIGPSQAALANATATSTAAQQVPIFQFDDSKVTALELTAGDKSARVEKNGDSWTVAGTGDPANKSSITSLIVRLSQLKATRPVDNPGSDLSQFGLDPPKDKAVATLDDGNRYELDTGNKTPVQTGTYAKKADAPDVYVIADQLVTDLERLAGDPKEPPTPTPRPATPTPLASPSPSQEAAPSPTP
jgi:hypothetical protein